MAFKRVHDAQIFRCPNDDCDSLVYMGTCALDEPMYHPGHGMTYSWVTGPSMEYGVLQLDGRYLSKDKHCDWFQIALGKYGRDFVTGKLLKLQNVPGYSMDGTVFLLDWESTVTQADDKLSVWVASSGDPSPVVCMVRLSDRYIYATTTFPGHISVRTCPLDRSSGWVEEYNSGYDIGASSTAIISESAQAGKVWMIYRNGRAFLYDLESKDIVGPTNYNFYDETGSADGFYRGTFVRELGVFVVFRQKSAGNWMEVYVPEVDPYSLSDPIALSTVQTGYATTIQVTLTGRHGEPIPDYPVNWSILSGTGNLSDTQSLTDDDGKAEVVYVPLIDSTSVEIQAEAAY